MVAPPASMLHAGVQKPASPRLIVVQPGMLASISSVKVSGSCRSQIQPVGHSLVPPCLQNELQKPRLFCWFETQSQVSVMRLELQPAPMASEGVVTVVVQMPYSVSQCWTWSAACDAFEPAAVQSASDVQPP